MTISTTHMQMSTTIYTCKSKSKDISLIVAVPLLLSIAAFLINFKFFYDFSNYELTKIDNLNCQTSTNCMCNNTNNKYIFLWLLLIPKPSSKNLCNISGHNSLFLFYRFFQS